MRQFTNAGTSLQCSPSLYGRSPDSSCVLKIIPIPALHLFPVNRSRMLDVLHEPCVNRSFAFILVLFPVILGVLAAGIWIGLNPLTVFSIMALLIPLVSCGVVFGSASFALSAKPPLLGGNKIFQCGWEDGSAFRASSHGVTFSTLAKGCK